MYLGLEEHLEVKHKKQSENWNGSLFRIKSWEKYRSGLYSVVVC